MHALLALLLASSCGDFDIDASGAPGSSGDFFDASGTPSTPDSASVSYFVHNFYTSRNNLGACTSTGDTCFLDNYYVDNATACVAVDGAGASITGLTQGTADTNYTAPYGSEATSDVNGTKHCYIDNADAYRTVWADPFTCISIGSSDTKTNASLQYATDHHDAAANNGWALRNEGDSARLLISATPSFLSCPASNSYGQEEKFGVVMARKTGDGASSSYHLGVNGEMTTCAAAAYDPGDPGASRDMAFFSRQAADLPFRGYGNRIRCYSEAKTEAWFDEQVARVDGRYNARDGVVITTDRVAATVHRVWHLDDDGYYLPFERGASRVDEKGIWIERARANLGTSSTAFSAMDLGAKTDVGTPIVSPNTTSGPMSRFRNTAEADTLDDNDVGVSEGKSTPSAGTTLDTYTYSVIIQPGTQSAIMISVQTDGTGTTEDTIANIASDAACPAERLTGWYRCSVTATITGSPTTITGRLLVGDAAGDTGTVIVSHMQLERADWAASPKSESTITVAESIVVPETEVDTWFGGQTGAAMSLGGEVSVVWTPDMTIPSGGDGQFQFLFCIRGENGPGITAIDHKLCLLRYPAAQGGAWTLILRNSTTLDSNDTDTAATVNTHVETAGTQYVMRARWTPCGTGLCHYIYRDTCADETTCTATTLIGSDVTGNKYVSDYNSDEACIGCRDDAPSGYSSHLDGHVACVAVCSVDGCAPSASPSCAGT